MSHTHASRMSLKHFQLIPALPPAKVSFHALFTYLSVAQFFSDSDEKLSSLGTISELKMHKNALEARAPPGPHRKTYSASQSCI